MQKIEENFIDLKGQAPMRCDRYVAEIWGLHSRSQLQSLDAEAFIQNKPVKWGYKVSNGQHICVKWIQRVVDFKAQDLPLDILWEDENVWVINKPCGMVVHPGAGQYEGTLANALAFRMGEKIHQFDTPTRAGIVHRLDRDTSGVIICAKNAPTHAFLSQQFQQRLAKKRYLALCKNTVECTYKGSVKNYIFRSTKDRKKFTCADSCTRGKYAYTGYEIIRQRSDCKLVLFKPYTGRTHQLRVHAKYLGFPILADPIYFPESVHEGLRLMLHAWKLRIQLPGETVPRTFIAPLPARFYEYWRGSMPG